MLYFKKFLKIIDDMSDIDIIIWSSVVLMLIIAVLLITPIFLSNGHISDTQKHTVVSKEYINKNNADKVLNSIKEKEPVTQNIVINNIVKEDNSNFLKDINTNIISDIISTILIATAGFLIGKFSRKKKVKFSKKEEFKI